MKNSGGYSLGQQKKPRLFAAEIFFGIDAVYCGFQENTLQRKIQYILSIIVLTENRKTYLPLCVLSF